jgi:hypothetical protein
MEDFYTKFIKPKHILKDINFFHSKICDVIKNDFFGKFLFNGRKKNKINEFVLNNFLSSFKDTRLVFVNDTIIVRFSIDKEKQNQLQDRSEINISKLIFRNYSIYDLKIEINICLSSKEIKNKYIDFNNIALTQLRKEIQKINEFYTFKFRQIEKRRFRRINRRLQNLKSTHYYEWNELLRLIRDCTDPSLEENFYKLKDVILGMNTDSVGLIHKVILNSELYRKFQHTSQIRVDKFIKNIYKVCLDSDEIIYLSNNLAWCMGYKIKTLKQSDEFLFNVLNHFNRICNSNLMFIQSMYNKTS